MAHTRPALSILSNSPTHVYPQTGCRPEPTGGSFVPLAPLNDSVFVPPTDASTPIQVDPEVTTPKTIIKDFVSVDMDENNNDNNDKPVVDDGGVLRPIHPLQPTMFFASTPASATATMTDAHKRAKDDNEANPNYGDLSRRLCEKWQMSRSIVKRAK